MTNPYQHAARSRKALALTLALRKHGISEADAQRMDEQQWRMAAEGAKVKLPSVETRGLMVHFLSEFGSVKCRN